MKMHLRKISDHVCYLPPDDFKDRPMLGYVVGTNASLAVDGGFSPDQMQGFYSQLIPGDKVLFLGDAPLGDFSRSGLMRKEDLVGYRSHEVCG